MQNITKAIDAIKNNEMVLIYDSADREGETDLMIPAKTIRPEDVAYMRIHGGGLICTVLPDEACARLGLPFMTDILKRSPDLVQVAEGTLQYDSRSSFSLWVNHRTTFTGIPDRDRALTIRKLDEIVESTMRGEPVSFSSEFQSPGHVAVLRGAKNLLKERKGQTELSIVLAMLAGINPVTVICEMLDAKTGYALTREDAKKYAQENNLIFVDGEEIASGLIEG